MSSRPSDDPVARTLALLLRPFADVKPFEVAAVLLMAATGFVLMTAYYFLKVTREPLILLSGGAELKSYAAAGQALLLLLLTRSYRALAARLDRRALTLAVFGFFAALVLLFALAAKLALPIGVPFYLFVGIFNLTVLSQFWSVAADFYSEEQGQRLFAVLGIGTSLGAIAGGYLGGILFRLWSVQGPLSSALLLLLLALGGLLLADRTIRARGERREQPQVSETPREGSLFADRYLLLLAGLILLLNASNALGEYVLDRVLLQAVSSEADIASFKSTYFTAFNVATLVLQSFLTSRVIRWFGGRGALFILPIVSMLGWGTTAIAPVLTVILIAKVAENAIDYSIQITSWQSMFLVLTRYEKYVAKNTIDTVFVRFGDVTAAVLVLIFARWLALSTVSFIVLNLVLILLWLLITFLLYREHPRKAARTAA